MNADCSCWFISVGSLALSSKTNSAQTTAQDDDDVFAWASIVNLWFCILLLVASVLAVNGLQKSADLILNTCVAVFESFGYCQVVKKRSQEPSLGSAQIRKEFGSKNHKVLHWTENRYRANGVECGTHAERSPPYGGLCSMYGVLRTLLLTGNQERLKLMTVRQNKQKKWHDWTMLIERTVIVSLKISADLVVTRRENNAAVLKENLSALHATIRSVSMRITIF